MLPMSRDDDANGRADRDVILARRRLFVASAFAGLAATQCDMPPFVCLSPPPAADAGALTPPTVCLAVPLGADAGAGGEAGPTSPNSDASEGDGSAE